MKKIEADAKREKEIDELRQKKLENEARIDALHDN